MADLNVCHECQLYILHADLVWGSRLVSRQTHMDPAEYEDASFHSACFVQHGKDAIARDLYWSDEAAHARHLDDGGLDVR